MYRIGLSSVAEAYAIDRRDRHIERQKDRKEERERKHT